MTDATFDAGPILHLLDVAEGRLRLAAVAVMDAGAEIPALTADGETDPGVTLHRAGGRMAVAWRFSLPMDRPASYTIAGVERPVRTDLTGDMRIAYASCNGQEEGDAERDTGERNSVWTRMLALHREEPFQILLQGGDQLYADEAARAHRLTDAWMEGEDWALTPAPDVLAEARETVDRAFLDRYAAILGQPEVRDLYAEVPSLCMWDDHDIIDGWGSHPVEMLDSPTGRLIFETARHHYLIFQRGLDPAEWPEAEHPSLDWTVDLPGLRIVAPDLRSRRRPDQVMDAGGWSAFRRAMRRPGAERILVMSSVPALGPRLSWVEAAMGLAPGAQEYEDDLRDQWQSRAHREAWRDFLSEIVHAHGRDGVRATVVSGEIHLAVRGEMEHPAGPVHQLVASGVTHPPPPPSWARALGALATLGENPLPRHPISMHPLPGLTETYAAEKNALVLVRRGGAWSTWWELDESGPTGELAL